MVKWVLTLDEEMDDNLTYLSIFFKLRKFQVIIRGLMFLKAYSKFIRRNPNGKVIFQTEKTKQEIIIIKDL